MTIADILDRTVAKEGGYSNHPADRGGPTMFGITERVARKNGFPGNMRDLSRGTALSIYRREYVTRPGFDHVFALCPAVAEELIDTGINMGTAVPALWLQQVLNAMNDGGRHYADIAEDGDIGPATLTALKAYLAKRGAEAPSVMLKALNGLQVARYLDLARRRTANEAFVFGWLRTRVGL